MFNAYLSFNGNCAEAFRFYEKVLGGKITALLPYGGTPAEAHMPPGMSDKIIHACMEYGGTLLMGGDPPPAVYKQPDGITVNINVTSPAEAERLYKALSEGGTIIMAMEKTFWAERYGMFRDRFGIPWMINCPPQAA